MARKTGRQILKENNKEGYVGNNEFEGDGAAIYRVSSLRQDAEDWSLGAQERFIREYAKSKGINLVREFVNQGCDYIEQKTAEIKHRIDVLNRRISKLYDDRMDGIITDDFYFEKRDTWQKELDELCFAFEKTATSNRNLIDDANLVIELGKDAYSLYLRQTPQEKAELMKLLTIELLFDGASLTITPHSAFSALLNLKKSHKLETRGVEPLSKMD